MTLNLFAKNKYSYKIVSKIVKNGGIAIVPTDTVYGFIVDVFNINAQKMLYKIKKRDFKKPFILMSYNIKNIKSFVKMSDDVLKFVKDFWPGQVTLILETTEIGKIVSYGRSDLGVRIPNNKFMLDLLNEIGNPVFSTSANFSLKKSAKDICDVSCFNNIVDVIVDGGKCTFSNESTILDMIKFPYIIVRNGSFNVKKMYQNI
jgi:L-threonylcarbamoyladenylate synthase